MQLSVELIAALLLIAGIVALAAQRWHIPYTVGLVLAGIAIAILPFAPSSALTKELIFTIFLPPLVFEAALYIDWKEFRKDLIVILTFATIGVILSSAVTAAGMFYLAGWGWAGAILFGALIAATDPVSVIATFKEAGVRGRLRMLVEGESLLNDSTASIGFTAALAVATGGKFDMTTITLSLLSTVIGGVICGWIVAATALMLAGRTEDHLIEVMFTTVAAYGSFLLAEHFHFSGVLASLTAGLLVGNVGPLGSITARGRDAVETFWQFIAFVVNSLVFIFIGIRVANQSFASYVIVALAAIVLVALGRALAIYLCSLFFARSARRVDIRHQHILFWGGLRGALALALALGLPPEITQRDAIVTVTFAVVAFSIFAQGLTVIPLLRRMGEISAS